MFGTDRILWWRVYYEGRATPIAIPILPEKVIRASSTFVLFSPVVVIVRIGLLCALKNPSMTTAATFMLFLRKIWVEVKSKEG